jgi:hypothetical protein
MRPRRKSSAPAAVTEKAMAIPAAPESALMLNVMIVSLFLSSFAAVRG